MVFINNHTKRYLNPFHLSGRFPSGMFSLIRQSGILSYCCQRLKWCVIHFLLLRVVVFSKIADKSVFSLLVLTWTLKLWCAKTVRKTVPILSSPNLTFLKIMPNVFSDTFQLIQAERYFLSFDLSVYWPEEYSYSPRNHMTRGS